MERIAIVVTADVEKKRLASAGADVRVIGQRAAVALPFNTSDRDVDTLAKKLGATLTVVEVEVESGMRCEDITAWTYDAPGRKNERDVSDEANDVFESWELDAAFDEEQVALAIAWALIERL